MVKNHFIKYLLAVLILLGCSLQSRKDQAGLRSLIAKKEFDQAISFLENSSLKSDEKNKLLYLMEKGTILYYQKKYSRAARVFVDANKLVDRLYTKSVRELLASSIVNDNSKTFYGSIFERSLLYYYQAMSFYQLAKSGITFEAKKIEGKTVWEQRDLTEDEIRAHYGRSRSTLIAWDSFFQELSRTKGLKTILRHDLLAKQMAANIHIALGTRSDKEIALQLYRDALGILEKHGPALKIFNSEFKEYNGKLRDFYDGEITKKKLVFNEKQSHYLETKKHIQNEILLLVKELRPYNLKRELRKFGLKQIPVKKSPNTQIVIESGVIQPLLGKDFSYNLRSAIAEIDDPNTRAVIEGVGVPILTYFALGPLGLGYASHHGNLTVYSSHGAGEMLTKEVGIEFELPYVSESKDNLNQWIQIYEGEKLITEQKLIAMSSLSDIAFINAQEMIENSFKKRAVRVGTKYALAIAAAYTTYKQMQESSGELFAKPAAYAQFLVSQKGIKASEKADSRHWSSVPSVVFNADIYLDEGKYDVKLVTKNEKGELVSQSKVGELERNTLEKDMFSYRNF